MAALRVERQRVSCVQSGGAVGVLALDTKAGPEQSKGTQQRVVVAGRAGDASAGVLHCQRLVLTSGEVPEGG